MRCGAAPFSFYFYDIKFLIWLCYWSCFRHSDKSRYCYLYIKFCKLLRIWFYVDFVLNLGYYHNAVQYSHKYINRQHISIRKNPCFKIYTTASPAQSPSVTSGLRVSVQPAKLASPIRFLYEELPKVYVFSAHRISRHFILLFPIGYLISRSWICLSSMCSVHC